MAQSMDDECGICLDALTNPVALPCSHQFCSKCLNSWRSKYGTQGNPDQKGKKCPLCRKKIPPSREMIMQLECLRNEMKKMEAKGDTLSRRYTGLKSLIIELEQEVGDWNGEVLDDAGEESLALPRSIFKAAMVADDVQKVLDWLGPPPVDKKRINAKCAELMNTTLVFHAVVRQNSGFLSILLQLGADVNAPDAAGGSALMMATEPERSQQACLLLEWGAETNQIQHGAITKDELVERALDLGNAKLANLLESELGGRRCELVNFTTRPELNGKTCVVEKYLPDKDRYKIVFEGSTEKALVCPHNLKRRDRTPTDCGYYITFKKGRYSRRDFASKEECEAYVAELEAKHATEKLAGMEIGVSGSSKTRRGKKGKKKGRK